MDAVARFDGWSHEALVDRIVALESAVSRENARRSWGASVAGAGLCVPNGQGSSRPSALLNSEPNPEQEQSQRKPKAAAKVREFDVTSQPCRKIALRFSYDGAPYAGLAAQSTFGDDPAPAASALAYACRSADADGADARASTLMSTSLPTVEGQLWRALCEARLVDPVGGMEGAGWTRCGRTDRGVSAAGQVVSLWVRSRRVDQWAQRQEQRGVFLRKSGRDEEVTQLQEERSVETEEAPFVPANEELPYVATLNRLLPPTIRIQAWSPVRPDFSARFDCRYRHYKYFFTSGAPRALQSLHPDGAAAPGWNHAGAQLDIDAMRDAACRLLGEHDFRNLCKIDSSKQIDNFRRRIDGVSVDVVEPGWPARTVQQQLNRSEGSPPSVCLDAIAQGQEERMYVLNLRGTAFLYHQVRHIVAVLFMVGARLESPSVVDELLNVHSGALVADRLALRARAIRTGVDAPPDSPSRWTLPNSTATGMQGKTAADVQRDVLASAGADTSTETAVSDKDVQEVSEAYQHLAVLESKPVYEMAADRPLVLWDCGFKPEDIQWRAGACDEPLSPRPTSTTIGGDPGGGTDIVKAIAQSCDRTAATTTMHLHSQWAKAAIQAELKRHFVLAAPSSASGGVLPASTLFGDARFPVLAPPAVDDVPMEGKRHEQRRIALPLGNGTSRSGSPGYRPLRLRKRDETAAEKNERWLNGKGKRRADARGVTALELAKGYSGGKRRQEQDVE
ncbi:pseudouridine synthase [Tilletiaria anomala UBC 951]|uniref:Pseudouridine synthase n=1 Tax=Tilletiaria anomala (strain ATCC 24038 / CBS 436.72 / UBC 951) TaxID=1037660 RepID=A0A066WQM9_TILAU|nr:pseudouridine synthase [Tilletiaria anomala UBC 951]KDN53319.1 pseudouridine synthase [Tilletiaria anomala UBC 951]